MYAGHDLPGLPSQISLCQDFCWQTPIKLQISATANDAPSEHLEQTFSTERSQAACLLATIDVLLDGREIWWRLPH